MSVVMIFSFVMAIGIFMVLPLLIAASAKLAKEQGAFPQCKVEEIMETPYFLPILRKKQESWYANMALEIHSF